MSSESEESETWSTESLTQEEWEELGDQLVYDHRYVHMNAEQRHWYDLRSACIDGDLDEIERLVRIWLAPTDKGKSELLRAACSYNHLEAIKYLIGIGADPLLDDGRALTSAVYGGHFEIVKYLTKLYPTIVNLSDRPLYVAAEYDRLDVVKYLVNLGVNLLPDKDDLPLSVACQKGHFGIVKFLIESGVSVQAHNNLALRFACGHNRLEIAKYLTERGADITDNDNHAIVWASCTYYPEIIKFLIEEGLKLREKWLLFLLLSKSRVVNKDILHLAVPDSYQYYPIYKALSKVKVCRHANVVEEIRKTGCLKYSMPKRYWW